MEGRCNALQMFVYSHNTPLLEKLLPEEIWMTSYVFVWRKKYNRAIP
jgi:hypothetical protein